MDDDLDLVVSRAVSHWMSARNFFGGSAVPNEVAIAVTKCLGLSATGRKLTFMPNAQYGATFAKHVHDAVARELKADPVLLQTMRELLEEKEQESVGDYAPDTNSEAYRRGAISGLPTLESDSGLGLGHIARIIAAHSAVSRRDPSKIDAVKTDGDDLGASALFFDDGSSLITVHRGLLDFLTFMSTMAWIAQAGEKHNNLALEDQHNREEFEIERNKLMMSQRALVRSRLTMLRLGNFFVPELGVLIQAETGTPGHLPITERYDLTSFILAHEAAHCLLNHTGQKRLLPGDDGPVQSASLTHDNEFAADQLACNLLSVLAEDGSPDLEFRTWVSSAVVVAAIHFWETGLFIRLSGTHPSARHRLDRIRSHYLSRFSYSRPWREQEFDSAMAIWGVQQVVDGASEDQVLPIEDWTLAITMPCLSDIEQVRLMRAHEMDTLICGQAPINLLDSSDRLPKSLSPIPLNVPRIEFEGYLQRIGLQRQAIRRLFDFSLPLMYSTAVNIISSCSALVTFHPDEREVMSYAILVNNIVHLRGPVGMAT